MMVSGSGSSGPSVRIKILAIVFGFVVAFVLVETGLRIKAAFSSTGVDPGTLPRTADAMPYPYTGTCGAEAEQSLFGAIVKPSTTPRLVYELKKGIDTCYYGARTRTNQDGLRGPREYARPKPEDTYRIMLLGDSQTFGQGVEFEETYGQVLETALRARVPDRPIEVINTGVGGYNLYQEAAYLEHTGVSYEPDLILVLFIQNDLDLPFFLYDPDEPLALDRSYAVELITHLAGGSGPGERWRGIPLDNQIPDEYAHMAGVAGYEVGLRTIARVARERGVSVLSFVDEPMARSVWGGEDSRAKTLALEQALGIQRPAFTFPVGFALNDSNAHLNAEGHRRLASQMLDAIDATDTIDAAGGDSGRPAQ